MMCLLLQLLPSLLALQIIHCAEHTRFLVAEVRDELLVEFEQRRHSRARGVLHRLYLRTSRALRPRIHLLAGSGLLGRSWRRLLFRGRSVFLSSIFSW